LSLRPSFAGTPPEPAGPTRLRSHASIDLLVRRLGERSLGSVLQTLLRHGDFARVLRRVYRMDFAGIEEALRAELR
jgi:hypothetical protein